jgi:MFS transporter, PPP family, 3-phenylpropionic acid transporter
MGVTAVFLICAFLMLASHGTYYGFFSIHLENLGFGSTFIGFTWAMAPLAEMAVMLGSNRIFKRFSLESILIFSFLLATLRWLILFHARSPHIILISQLLHAGTYGAFHIASILYIDRLAPAEAKTLGQAVNNALTYGLGMMAGFLFNGALYESLGGFALFGISGGIACLGGVLFTGVHLAGTGNPSTPPDPQIR